MEYKLYAILEHLNDVNSTSKFFTFPLSVLRVAMQTEEVNFCQIQGLLGVRQIDYALEVLKAERKCI